MDLKNIYITDIKVTLADTVELLSAVMDYLTEENQNRLSRIVSSGNVHSFNMAHALPWYKKFLNESDIVRLDGAGIALAARCYGHHPPKRSTWADFGWPLLEMFAREKVKVFFFGCAPGMAAEAAERARERFPALKVTGTEHGFIDWKNPDSDDNRRLIGCINQADVLIIGLGMPRQEQWILEHRDALEVKVIMTGGAVFNYLAGHEKRAPKWMLNSGLEWLFRLLLEPKRMFRRYVIGNPAFLMRVLVDVFSPR
jgi:N-acetylglucosaminyldiphosphoundecaprenol N-acetyl-beta-D-mannosaminyltransferase